MKRKRHGTDAIIRKLREAETLEAQGQGVAQVCQRLEISEQTLHRWRKQFRGMGDDQIKQVKELREENRRLKKAVADLVLDKQIIEDVLRGKDCARRACATSANVRHARWKSRSAVGTRPSGGRERRSDTYRPSSRPIVRWSAP